MQNGNPHMTDLEEIRAAQSTAAAANSSGRSAATVYGGAANALRQTVIALTAGSRLNEHENPGEATLQVLSGRVRLVGVSGETLDGNAGTLLVIPDERHHLDALEDAVVLLTVAKHR